MAGIVYFGARQRFRMVFIIAVMIALPYMVTAAPPPITEFPGATLGGVPWSITNGPDGNLWFTDTGHDRIRLLTPDGVFDGWGLPTPGSFPYAITSGPDGNLWFTELYGDRIGRIT